MIKCDKGNVVIEGMKSLVLSELTTLVHVLTYEVFMGDLEMSLEEAKENIQRAFELGLKPEEEVREQAKADLKDMLGQFGDMLGGVLNEVLNVLEQKKEAK